MRIKWEVDNSKQMAVLFSSFGLADGARFVILRRS